jgi:hypothetical protein
LFRQPDASAPPPIPEPPEPPLDEELEWRAAAMRNEQGVIPLGAIYTANVFRRQQLLTLVPLQGTGLNTPSLSHLVPRPATYLSSGSWTSRGPQNAGGRTRSLLIDPNAPTTMYAGSVSGGIWKSTDGGSTWHPQDDFMANLAIMTLAFDPSVVNRSAIYAGTGESLLRGDGVQGAGIFKSTDFGVTWTQLTSTANWPWVPRVAINLAGTIIAAANKGIFVSQDHGVSWLRTFSAADAGFAQSSGGGLVVVFDPNNSQKAIAEVVDWDSVNARWPHKVLYSNNAGAQWNIASLPATLTNYYDHIELAYSPSEPDVIYANASTAAGADGGEIWKSTNGGQSFQRMTTSGVTHCNWGACTIWVSPVSLDSNILIVTGGSVGANGIGGISRSTNGGVTVTSVGTGWGETLSGDAHADQHSIVTSPTFSSLNRQVYICTDGGIFRTDNISTVSFGNGTWIDLNRTYQTAQYHGAAGNSSSGAFIGGTQDDGTLRTTQASTDSALVAGGDGGFAAIDPTDPSYVYGEFQYLDLFRSRNGGTPNTWSFIGRDGGPKPLADAATNNAAFIGPFVLDAHNPNTMIAGGLSVWRSTNVKANVPNWDVIRAPGHGVMLSLAQARTDSNVIWLAEIGRFNTSDPANGTIARTTNGTLSNPSWSVIRTQDSLDGLPPVAATSVYVDPDDSATVYVTFGDFSGHTLWRTTNGNDPTPSWMPAYGSGTTALPPAPARTVVRHPRNSSVLFVGTEVGIYESDDSGQHWTPSPQVGPTDASVYDLRFVYGSDQLLVATHGRGLWTADTASIPNVRPTNLVATAQGTTSVNVTWTAYAGAMSYQLFKSSMGSAFAQVPVTVTTNSYSDTDVVAGRTYLYRVRGVTASGVTDLSNVDLATTVTFTNDNALVGTTVLASHLQEVRDATNMVLTAAGLATISFGTLTPGVTIVHATDITDVRSALKNAYYSIGLAIPAFAEAVTAGTTIIKAGHVQELRNYMK